MDFLRHDIISFVQLFPMPINCPSLSSQSVPIINQFKFLQFPIFPAIAHFLRPLLVLDHHHQSSQWNSDCKGKLSRKSSTGSINSFTVSSFNGWGVQKGPRPPDEDNNNINLSSILYFARDGLDGLWVGGLVGWVSDDGHSSSNKARVYRKGSTIRKVVYSVDVVD